MASTLPLSSAALALILAVARAASADPVVDAPIALSELRPDDNVEVSLLATAISAGDVDGGEFAMGLLVADISGAFSRTLGGARIAVGAGVPIIGIGRIVGDSGYSTRPSSGAFIGNPRLALTATSRRASTTVGGGVDVYLGLGSHTGDYVAARLDADPARFWSHAHVMRVRGDLRFDARSFAVQLRLGLERWMRDDLTRDQHLLGLAASLSVPVSRCTAFIIDGVATTDAMDEQVDEGYDLALALDLGLRWVRGSWAITGRISAPVAPRPYLAAGAALRFGF
jgi:hypothetical protein